MTERTEIEKAILRGLAAETEDNDAAARVVACLRALFAEKPWLMEELMPKGFFVAMRDKRGHLRRAYLSEGHYVFGAPAKLHRSSVTGRFVTEDEAKADPDRTQTEERK